MTIEAYATTGSSNIESVSYDSDLEELVVEFRDGSEYAYSGVPRSVFDEMQSALSVGRFLHRHLKGRYATRSL